MKMTEKNLEAINTGCNLVSIGLNNGNIIMMDAILRTMTDYKNAIRIGLNLDECNRLNNLIDKIAVKEYKVSNHTVSFRFDSSYIILGFIGIEANSPINRVFSFRLVELNTSGIPVVIDYRLNIPA